MPLYFTCVINNSFGVIGVMEDFESKKSRSRSKKNRFFEKVLSLSIRHLLLDR